MSGNVWEWTMSDYHSGRKPDDFRFDHEVQSLYDKVLLDKLFEKLKEETRQLPVRRGGSWDSNLYFACCAYRFRFNPENRFSNVGFRCIRT